MRCSGWSSLAISVCSGIALLLAGPAAGHVVAIPAFLPTGSSESIMFSGPNERDQPMTGFALTVPEGLEIAHAHEVDGWDESVEGSTATWLGGPLAPEEEIAFGMTVAADVEPGVVEVEAEQRYQDGVVNWSVALTVTPGTDEPSQHLALAAVIGVIGLLVVAAVGALAWRRRA